ncbi:hypothetical protein [Nonomuraea rubra]|uniref:Ribosomal protein L40E n=1 Tax=Nonomuraea rubra TaxID=46180 RepID=A0A7X0P800_9ACTN|nr:hypothetical protein [Nonomuraea rubra]MBB6556985.1 ribosomal protein L40E [Nonomuraea rubra]
MTRFRCLDCGQRSDSIIGCRRCGTVTGRRAQLCPAHGAGRAPGCRACRVNFRSEER